MSRSVRAVECAAADDLIMSTNPSFARLHLPPYYSVIFSSLRTEGDNGYAKAADRMVELAGVQPGWVGTVHGFGGELIELLNIGA